MEREGPEFQHSAGKKPILPQDQAFHPDAEGLKWRREQLIA